MNEPWRILTVCTANMCRSPMAEGLLAAQLAGAAAVSSCGLLADGYSAAPEVVEAMAARGVDLGAHRSRQLGVGLIDGSDLILAMAREHLREVVVRRPDAFGRTFTLKEIVRRGRRTGPRRPGVSLGDWLAEVGGGRRPQDLLGASGEDDVGDPIGGAFSDYAGTAQELEGLCLSLVGLLRPGVLPPLSIRHH